MIVRKMSAGQFYNEKIQKVRALPSLREQQTTRRSSVEELFYQISNSPSQSIVKTQNVKKGVSGYTFEEDLVNDKRRSVSNIVKQLTSQRQASNEAILSAQRERIIESISKQMDQKLNKQTIQLKKLEIQRNEVNEILGKLINSKMIEEVRKIREITDYDLDKPKQPSRTIRQQELSKDKIGTIYDPNRFQGIYEKAPQYNNFKMPNGPLLSFRQFLKSHGHKMPRFIKS